MKETRVLLGVVTSAHGIKGEVKVKTFTQTPEGLGAYGPVTTQGGRALTIAALRPGKGDDAVVRFEGIADRSTAESLKGQGLYVPRAALPAGEANEFYHADLIGLRAEDASGKTLGTVRALHNFGAGDLIEIEFPGGETEFLPFTDANVPAVDVAGGRVVVVLPKYDDDSLSPQRGEGEGAVPTKSTKD